MSEATTQLESQNAVAANGVKQSKRLSVEDLLTQQQSMTAVEKFARLHESHEVPEQEKYYRDLIPLNRPGDGQQYAFEVDLDVCSGCKGCVSACHHLNGLEPTETWRWVGQLYGTEASDSSALPVIQHVTTACHHCLEPACLAGCPTEAYVKDPDTGIVRHLDDQCFGCQYCTMACPYEVPQYSHDKGIVRKCDMCHGRLAEGEAPACVQACPNQAIRIQVVDVEEVQRKAAADDFLPSTPNANITQPTTNYRRENPLTEDATAADWEFSKPQHAHPPLVGMLVLTQLGVGTLMVVIMARWLGLLESPSLPLATGFAAGIVGMMAGLNIAPLHLGRPHLAFRAVLGWRHSWLSREAIVFGMIPPLAIGCWAFASKQWLLGTIYDWTGFELPLPDALQVPVEIGTMLVGAAGIYCSARIYQFCQREYWNGWRTMAKFFLTAVTLGGAIAAAALAATGGSESAIVFSLLTMMLGGLTQLAADAEVFRFRNNRESTLRLTAKLMQNDLKQVTYIRFAAGIGAVVLLAVLAIASVFIFGADSLVTIFLTGLVAIAALVGEFASRFLYFAAVVPKRMPGGIG